MKNLNRIFMIGAVVLALSGCGSGNNTAGNLQNGYYTQNGVTYGPGGIPMNGGGCIGLGGGTLAFSAQGASINDAIILAGNLPALSTSPGPHGQVYMGAQAMSYNGMGMLQISKSSSSGVIQLNLNGPGSFTGAIQLSQQVAYAVMAYSAQGYSQYNLFPYTQPYTGGYPNNGVCATSVALDVVYTANTLGYGGYQQTGYINQALVYLMLNNGQSVGPIPFY